MHQIDAAAAIQRVQALYHVVGLAWPLNATRLDV